MIVTGKKIEYLLYIEGVLVPTSSVSISNATGSGASFTFDVLPIPSALDFIRGMLVHLFKKVDDQDPVLRFFGILKNIAYSKDGQSRSVNMEVGSLDSRWDTMSLIEFEERANIGPAENYAILKFGQGAALNLIQPKTSVDVALDNAPDYMNVEPIKEADQEEKQRAAGNAIMGKMMASYDKKSVFLKDIESVGGNIFAGLITTIKNAYMKSNGYNTVEYNRTKLDSALKYLSVGLASSDMFQVKFEGDIEEQIRAKVFSDLVESIVGNGSGATPLKVYIQSLLQAFFSTMSVDPTRTESSILLHPMMMSFMPPKCNVIFPGQYSSITFNPNKWSEPTRTIAVFPPWNRYMEQFGIREIESTRAALVGDAAAEFQKINFVNSGEAPAADYSVASFQQLGRILTHEEMSKGVLCNIINLENPTLYGMSNEASLKMANYAHYAAKLGCRTCLVRGELIDDVAVGFPIVILDNEFTIYGIAQGLSYSVTEGGQLMSQLSISCPQFIMKEVAPDAPMWLNLSALAPNAIHSMYEQIFGCGSIYDPSVQVTNPKSPTEVIRACSRDLISKYMKSGNKSMFRDVYRKRREQTEYDVFTKVHGCTALKASDGSDRNLLWTGKDFGGYKAGESCQIDNAPTNNRQSIVLKYLKDYYATPGRYEI